MHVRKCIVCECQQMVMNGLTRKCVTLKWVKAGEYLAVHFVLQSQPAELCRMEHRNVERQMYQWDRCYFSFQKR